MGKVYAAPVKRVAFNSDWKAYEAAENKYVADVQAWARANSNDPAAGEVIKFGVADGYAQYVVVGLKPVKLVHLEIGDAYQFQYVSRLSAADIRQKIAQQKAFAKVFAG